MTAPDGGRRDVAWTGGPRRRSGPTAVVFASLLWWPGKRARGAVLASQPDRRSAGQWRCHHWRAV